MLVLNRKPTESVWVGDAEVRILKVNGPRVTLGIAAEPETHIIRDELLARSDRSATHEGIAPDHEGQSGSGDRI
jgi:carbon storage regulator CsrA